MNSSVPGKSPDRVRCKTGLFPLCFLAGRQTECSASQTEESETRWTWPVSCVIIKNDHESEFMPSHKQFRAHLDLYHLSDLFQMST